MDNPRSLDPSLPLLACPSCDGLYEVSMLKEGEAARCERCGHFLTCYRSDELHRVSAYAISALIMLLLACSFPFLEFRSSGLESQMTLLQTPLSLYQNGMAGLAILVAAFIILIPAALLLILALLSFGLSRFTLKSWLRPLARTFFAFQSWSMVEVFLIGVLVSLVKLANLATIVLGISFWAYVGFAILFTLSVSSLDRFQCWRRIEEVCP